MITSYGFAAFAPSVVEFATEIGERTRKCLASPTVGALGEACLVRTLRMGQYQWRGTLGPVFKRPALQHLIPGTPLHSQRFNQHEILHQPADHFQTRLHLGMSNLAGKRYMGHERPFLGFEAAGCRYRTEAVNESSQNPGDLTASQPLDTRPGPAPKIIHFQFKGFTLNL